MIDVTAPRQVKVGAEASFQASTDGQSHIVSWAWDVSNTACGESKTGPSTIFFLQCPLGTPLDPVTVYVTATDDQGESSSLSKTIQLKPSAPQLTVTGADTWRPDEAATPLKGTLKDANSGVRLLAQVVFEESTDGGQTWSTVAGPERVMGAVTYYVTPYVDTDYRLVVPDVAVGLPHHVDSLPASRVPKLSIRLSAENDRGIRTVRVVDRDLKTDNSLAGMAVLLQKRLVGGRGWTVVASRTTDSHGRASAVVDPARATQYRWKARIDHDRGYNMAFSPLVLDPGHRSG